MTNPFTPTFGIVPMVLAGRKELLSQMHNAFERGIGDPNLSSILIGPRGTGKTALLSCIGSEARKCGWLCVDTVAMEGMLEDIVQQSLRAAEEFLSPKPEKKISGVSVAGVLSLSWIQQVKEESNWRMKMSSILEELKNRDIGLLITVDEVRVDVPEMIQLASFYQLFIRENAKISLVLAGLPGQVHQMLTHKEVSFLRRARQHVLDKISDREIREAFKKTVESEDKIITSDALDMAVKASGGFAYMMQLVGYFIWEESGDKEVITEAFAAKGIDLARVDFQNGVLDSTWRELSKGDRAFLAAMLSDSRYSTLTDIAKRMGKTTGYASTYKSRLLLAGVIEEQPGETFAYAIPALRDYITKLNVVETNNHALVQG